MYCVYCGDYFSNNKSLVNHRKICKLNPKSDTAKERETNKKEEEYLNIVNKIESFNDIIKTVDEYMAERGYVVHWESIPSNFSIDINHYEKTVSNNKKTQNVGWKGNWKGKIERIPDFKGDNYRRCSFWDINGDMSGIYDLKFLRTNGGSWGSSFSGEGYILLNDFPKLIKKYEKQASKTKIKQDLSEITIRLDKLYQNRENEYIKNDELKIKAHEIQQKMRKNLENLSTVIRKRETTLRNKFRNETTIPLPSIEDDFQNLSGYMELKNKFASNEKVALDDDVIKDAIKDLEGVYAEYKAFTNEYSEFFI